MTSLVQQRLSLAYLQQADQFFLRMKIRFATKPSPSLESEEHEEGEESEELSYSSHEINKEGEELFEGNLDWVFNDVYQMAAPYLKVWNARTGEVQSSDVIETWIKEWRCEELGVATTHNSINNSDDHRVYYLGTLVSEYHPVLIGQSYFTLHLCEVVSLIEQVALDTPAPEFSAANILAIFSILGPFVGFNLHPVDFRALWRLLTGK